MILKYEKYIATFFNLLFTFFASVLIARGLSLSDRGFYGEILYYSSLAAMIFCPPVFEYLSKFVKRQYDRNGNTSLILNFFFLYSFFCIPIFLIIGLTLSNALGIEIENLLIVFCISIVTAISTNAKYNFINLNSHKYSYFFDLFSILIYTAIVIYLFFSNEINLVLTCLAISIQFFLNFLFHFGATLGFEEKKGNLKNFHFKLKINEIVIFVKKYHQKILSAWSVMILFAMYTAITRFFITKNVDDDVLGIFFTSYMILISFIGIFLNIYRPYIYSKSSLFDRKKISRKDYFISVGKPIFLTITLTPLGIIFGDDVFILIYGQSFSDASFFWSYLYLSILMFTLVNMIGVCARGLSFPLAELVTYIIFLLTFVSGYYFFNIGQYINFDFLINIYILEFSSLAVSLVIIFLITLRQVLKT